MKKKIALLLCLSVITVGGLTGCGNRDMFDTVYTYDYAIIRLPNDEIVEGKVETWCDYEDGEQLQVKINGVTYLTDSINCTMYTK